MLVMLALKWHVFIVSINISSSLYVHRQNDNDMKLNIENVINYTFGKIKSQYLTFAKLGPDIGPDLGSYFYNSIL